MLSIILLQTCAPLHYLLSTGLSKLTQLWDDIFSEFVLLSSSTQICESAGECLSDRKRGYPVQLFHTHYSFTTNQVQYGNIVTAIWLIWSLYVPNTHIQCVLAWQVVERWQRADRPAKIFSPERCSEWDLVFNGHLCNRGRYWTVWVRGMILISIKSTIYHNNWHYQSNLIFCLV